MVACQNVYRGYQNRQNKRDTHFKSPDCFGVKTLRSEYIGDLLATPSPEKERVGMGHASSFATVDADGMQAKYPEE